MATAKSDVLQGTLDLMVLTTLEAMGEMHGYGIARRIEQVSEDVLQANQGNIYAALLRFVQARTCHAKAAQTKKKPTPFEAGNFFPTNAEQPLRPRRHGRPAGA
jgi:hypothetical protein